MVQYGESANRIGSPSLGLGADVIATVLELLRSAWRAVVRKQEVGPSSTEPAIAGRLGRHILAEKKRRGVTTLRVEEEVGTRSSPEAPKAEGRIDIKVIYSFTEEEYFGIECKRLGGDRAQDLAREYITEGVLRFVTGKYSPGHAWCAMVGFVIDGRVREAVQCVSEQMSKRREAARLNGSCSRETRFGSHDHLYRTVHGQTGHSSRLAMLHLFLGLGPPTN